MGVLHPWRNETSCQPVIVSFTAHWLALRLNLIRTLSLLSFKYRRLLLYWALFYCTLQILYFLQIENLWQLCIEQGFGIIFLTAFAPLLSHFVCMCHLLVILTIFLTFLHYGIYYGDQ